MPCPVCGAAECNSIDHLPNEVLQNVMAHLPARSSFPLVSRRFAANWRQVTMLQARFIACPSGDLGASVSEYTGAFGTGFGVRVEFHALLGEGLPPEVIRNAEYRQYVRGYFKRDGKPVEHSLPRGKTLSETKFRLDGPKGSDEVYGQRSARNRALQRACTYTDSFVGRPVWNPDGRLMTLFDDPRIRGEPEETLEINLEFRGKVFDMRTQAVLCERDWTVKGVRPGKKD